MLHLVQLTYVTMELAKLVIRQTVWEPVLKIQFIQIGLEMVFVMTVHTCHPITAMGDLKVLRFI